MASLALFASLVFLIVVFIAPVSYLISLCVSVPRWLIYVLAIINVIIGLWWFFLPLPAIRYVGLINVYIGWILCGKGDKR
jgi:cytochrome c biogenesis protein CcdA